MSLFFFRQRKNLKKYSLASPDITKTLIKSGFYLFIALSLHVIAMLSFENLSLADAIWLTFTTITTVGYGDLSAATLEGRISTIVILFLGGIFILADAAGQVFTYFTEKQRKKIKGQWRWDMSAHILIMNAPVNSGGDYFEKLIKQFRETKEYRDHPIQIVTNQFQHGLPLNLQELDGVVYFNGRPEDVTTLNAVNANEADLIIILSKDDLNSFSDGRTFDILHRLKDMQVKAKILAECVDDNNRERIKNAGAELIIRPIRAYPEMIVRSFVAPGSEKIIENMFTNHEDEYKRYDITFKADKWSDIVCKLTVNNLGTAIGFIEQESGELICNPSSERSVESNAIFVMVREKNIPDCSTMTDILKQN